MTQDFYCNEVLNGHTPVQKVAETENVLAFHHTRPYYPVHIVVIPKRHIASLIVLESHDDLLLLELFAIIKRIAAGSRWRIMGLAGSSPILGITKIQSIYTGMSSLDSH